ncbi:mucin-22-like [Macrobrachium rosenbergii]|uniref:mucin-22-like n=1 Tax=Macrobrachium rosenbergii TaxID=79674 RepID=UPI0034D5F833
MLTTLYLALKKLRIAKRVNMTLPLPLGHKKLWKTENLSSFRKVWTKNTDTDNVKEDIVVKNSIMEMRQMTPGSKTDQVNQMLNTRPVVGNQEESSKTCGEGGKCSMVGVNSTISENTSNTVVETWETASSSDSATENGNNTLATLSLTTLLETGNALGKQRIDKTVETTQTMVVGEVNTVAVTSVLNAGTISWIPSHDNMIAGFESSLMPVEKLVSSSVMLNNSHESLAPAVEAATTITTATNTVNEVGESSLVMSENKDTELNSSYDVEYPVTRISNAETSSTPVSLLIDLKSSEFSISMSEVLDSNHVNYSTLTSGIEATPVIEMSEVTGFAQVIPVSNVPVTLISNKHDKDNVTAMMNTTYISPNITEDHQPALFEPQSTSSIEHMVQDSVEYNEHKSPTVELLDTGMLGLVTTLKNFSTRHSAQLESSLHAISGPSTDLNDLGALSSRTMLESSSQAGDEGKPTDLTNDIILVEMASFTPGEDTNSSHQRTNLAGNNGDTDLISRTGKSLNLDKTLPSIPLPSTYSADGANTFAPKAYSKGSKELPVEFRNFLLPNTELAITESNIKYTTTKTYYIIMRPAKTSLVPTTIEKVSATMKKNSAHFTSIPHSSQGSNRLYQPSFIKPSPDSQEQFNDYLKSVGKESSESNSGKKQFLNWIFG